MSNKNFGFGTQIRKSPYFDSTVKWGATGFSVYNHMYIPRDFGSPEQNFWNLIKNQYFVMLQLKDRLKLQDQMLSNLLNYLHQEIFQMWQLVNVNMF